MYQGLDGEASLWHSGIVSGGTEAMSVLQTPRGLCGLDRQ